MNTNRNKDLSELISKFHPADEAGRCEDDIRLGDEMLEKYPAPSPRPDLLADIKTQMLLAHHRSRKARHAHRVFGSMALAASLAIICGLAWLFTGGRGNGVEPAPLGTFRVIAQATHEIGTYSSELDLIEDSIETLKSVDFDSSPAGYQSTITAFENSLWKG